MKTLGITSNTHFAKGDVHSCRNSDSSSQILKNINKVALPAIALYAAANTPISDAGPIIWAACIAICESAAAAATVATAGAAAPSLIACVASCGPLLLLPFPP